MAVATIVVCGCKTNVMQGGLEKGSFLQPRKSFAESEPPPPPDYSAPADWGCLPDRNDPCDAVPANTGLTDGQARAQVDCFAVYPTTMYRRYGWNARLDDKTTRRITDNGPLKQQFSVYNGSCRVFAPYYRQAGLGAFTLPTGDPDQKAALALASEDVLSAFQYYLDHFDTGKPIIIAGHSQGIRHAIRVLEEYFAGKPLQKRLVAAYLIGGSLHEETFTALPVCDSAVQTGCVLGWRTVAWGSRTNDIRDLCTDCENSGIKWVCVNPLTWRHNDEPADASLNLGGVPRSFDRIDPHLTAAKCDNGSLWINPPEQKGYPALGDNYHVCDYSLFYLNIRRNVADRIKAYRAE
jgi:hypothetical protein